MPEGADELKGLAPARLAATVAHEINNHLAVILGTAELALDELPAGHPQRQDLQQILRAGEGLRALAARLLALSRGA